ncbi:hypothetical protein ACHAXR_010974 [Thalassiosira sp. AJA248-18]
MIRAGRVHKLEFSANDGDQEPGGGVYVDLGSIPFDDNDASTENKDDEKIQNQPYQIENESIDTTIEKWRSNHWIVLIDDEPAIRLAIGDYLHSMGYSVITACDGPMAFLDMILWSCSWSLLKHNKEGEGGQGPPPWIKGESHQQWRLPSCIISDIRMPGGIDGVHLLELLRRSPEAAEKDKSYAKAPKKKGRGRPRKGETGNMYDEKDDFELLDAIVVGDSAGKTERITTPTDQALQYLEAIRGCIDYFDQDQSIKGKGKEQQYPSSMQQIPVILLTAKAMVSDRIVGYKAGANGYLPKPFRPEELLGMVDNLMRKQQRQSMRNLISNQNDGIVVDDGHDVIADLTPEEATDITKELVEIKELLQARIEQQGTEEETIEKSLLPEAMWMLRTGERRKKIFTKEHIRSILSFCFGVDFPRNNTRRDVLLAELEEQIVMHPDILSEFEKQCTK